MDKDKEGIVHVDLVLDKKDLTALIFKGMTETEYDTSLIVPYEGVVKEKMLTFHNFKKACADNGVSEEDGFIYIQIGIQTTFISSIHSLTEEDAKCGKISSDHQDHIDQG